MTLVKIEVKASAIHGLGCFAAEPIAVGQLIWKFDGQYDHVLKKEFIETLPAAAKENLLNYAFVSKTTGDYILCSDDSRFTNHSPTANVVCVIPPGTVNNDLECYAIRPILPGDEITNDYREFDAESGEDFDLS
jgi:uncharacterized protein